jgi:hypothetical protein
MPCRAQAPETGKEVILSCSRARRGDRGRHLGPHPRLRGGQGRLRRRRGGDHQRRLHPCPAPWPRGCSPTPPQDREIAWFGADGYTTVAQADALARRLELRSGWRLLDAPLRKLHTG